MCENRDGKFVVKQIVSAGWFIGQVTGAGRTLQKMNGEKVVVYPVNILRVQNPNYQGASFLYTSVSGEFDSPEEAMAFLDSKGVAV